MHSIAVGLLSWVNIVLRGRIASFYLEYPMHLELPNVYFLMLRMILILMICDLLKLSPRQLKVEYYTDSNIQKVIKSQALS